MKPTIDALMSIACTFGINMKADGDFIELSGWSTPPPDEVIELFRECKSMLLDFLRHGGEDEYWERIGRSDA